MTKTMNNVVTKDIVRHYQKKTLKELANILVNSFGPEGSNACIKQENALPRYTKDGHSIISAIHYNGIMEESIKDDIESITRHIVKTVGDGTTSAVILSSLIFNEIVKIEQTGIYTPKEILDNLSAVVKSITDEIHKLAKPLTVDDVYDIAMISTNGNEFVANQLKEIYEEFGNEVFIDVTPSTGEEFIVKSYNGMTLNTGYSDPCYITNTQNNTAEVDRPEVYFFEHPIDTKELGIYLDAILAHNIVEPCNTQQYDKMVPTVIFAPKISQDMSAVMDSIVASMATMPVNNKLPVCVIVDYHEVDQLIDLAKMCGAKMIRKYIDPKVYEADVARGAAPTKETIFEWAGTCDRVVAYSNKTTFINPSKMRNEDGSYTELYNNIINYLESTIATSIADGENIREVGKLKRRLYSLKSNFVELFVGGITQADRDALRDLVEDAVLNIRSASKEGVGLGGNMSACVAIRNLKEKIDINSTQSLILDKITEAYIELINILFGHYIPYRDKDGNDKVEFYSTRVEHALKGRVFNISERQNNTNVKSSIMSDITILDTVSKIIGIMATCNQFIVPTAMHNIYTEIED